jgi:hypothetical protein
MNTNLKGEIIMRPELQLKVNMSGFFLTNIQGHMLNKMNI